MHDLLLHYQNSRKADRLFLPGNHFYDKELPLLEALLTVYLIVCLSKLMRILVCNDTDIKRRIAVTFRSD